MGSSDDKLLLITQQVTRDCNKLVKSVNRQEDALRLKRIASALSKEVAFAAKIGQKALSQKLQINLKELIQATRVKLKDASKTEPLKKAIKKLSATQEKLLNIRKGASSKPSKKIVKSKEKPKEQEKPK